MRQGYFALLTADPLRGALNRVEARLIEEARGEALFLSRTPCGTWPRPGASSTATWASGGAGWSTSGAGRRPLTPRWPGGWRKAPW